MDVKKLQEVACAEIDKYAEDLAALSHVIWSNPELALEEHKAHDALTEFLSKHNFDKVEKNFVLPTGFRAVYGDKTKGPHVAIMSEFDALPDIGHACGHNLIAEVGVAAAIGVKAALQSTDVPFGQVIGCYISLILINIYSINFSACFCSLYTIHVLVVHDYIYGIR